MPDIQNMLIDLGDVLYKIDIQKSRNAFQALRDLDAGPIDYSKAGQHEVFTALEIGAIDPNAFVEGLTDAYGLKGSKEAVLAAWNAVLVGVIPEREKQLATLSNHFRMSLLSNTNIIHYEQYQQECAPLFQYLDHLFLSYEMGMRKPDAEIFETALAHMGWKARETLFVDDSENNIEAAKAVGLHTFWMEEISPF